MNNYPAWWNTTLTVYNKYENPTTREITWFKHKLTNCFWKYTGNKVVVGETVLDTNNTICRVPKDDNFVEGYLWNALTAEEKATKFTFKLGDIIVKGEPTDVISEYTAGSRSSDLITKYKKLQGCVLVESVAINTTGNRCNEHYYIKGT